jgi:crotonobetainyl-CoA:carnitine CoA-transferase CaiB-like acyl-CoA transferase
MLDATAGLRVLDLTEGLAGPLVTMILADFGAEVVRVEPETATGLDEPSHLLLDRGKKHLHLDPASAEGAAALRELVPTFDVVVVALPVAEVEEAGLGYEALRELNPALVYCDITGFGRTGPLAQLPAEDGLVMAKAGVFRGQAGWHADGGRPVFRAGKEGSYFAAMLALQGILAALRVREITGEGQQVSATMLQGLTCRQNPAVRWLLRKGEELPSESVDAVKEQDEANTLPHHRDPRVASLIGMLVECKDGRWIVHSLTEPHFFPAWISVLGFDWIWEDDRYKGAPYSFPDKDTRAELISLIKDRMKTRTAAEWMELYLASGNVCGDVVQTTQEALRHPQLAATAATIEVDDPRVGRLLQIGPLAKVSAVSEKSSGSGPQTDDLSPGPLSGITIIEAAYYYATPFGTALLTDLGARVIKLEPVRGDPYRALAGGRGGGDPVVNLGHNNMVRAMQGKESIALNLKDPRGQEILRRLVAQADVFVHSFRPGVPESLGIDEETLRKIKPDLVYHYGASYGSVGPYSGQPAIDPVIAAFAGTTAYQAGEGNPPLTETGADPIAAAGHAAALMLGLFARERTGRGQHVESQMIVSNIYLNCEDALAYDGKPDRRGPDRLQLGTSPARRLYETARVDTKETIAPYANPDPHWVFLSAEDDVQFGRFCAVAGRDDIAADSRFCSRAAREENGAALEELLEEVFLTRSAPEWERAAVAEGVGCVMADAMSHFTFLHRDPQAAAVAMMTMCEHPSFGGAYWRHAPALGFSRTPGRAKPFCEKGEHTRRILGELGYGDEEMTRLKEDDVITWPAEQSETAMALS